ncbi:MAG: right-handed parallel beta-helix repeat-containing protein [Acidobacteriaceae bacterium]|nr:right-handed parallel beta-helix repeat-containing protein [Acidobacteriaceae bacterium]
MLLFLVVVTAAYAQSVPFCDVKRFGATGNGSTADTAGINRAIDSCSQSGGGTVYFPGGTYLSGTILLRDKITLWLDSGATLVGSKDLTQYKTAVAGQDWYGALILAKSVRNVMVMGRGTIDGNNVFNPNGEEHMRGPHALMFYDCEDIAVRDITVRDSGNYAVIVRDTQRVNIDGLTVKGGWDGINMHDAKDGTISNCRLYTGDDSLAGAYWENVTVTNCILNSSANAIRVGGRNVLIQNCVIYGPAQYAAGSSLRHRVEAGFQILPNRANPKNKYAAPGPVDNIVLSGITMINVATPVFIAYSGDAPYSNNNLGVGRIIMNDVTVLEAGKTPFYVSAPPSNPAKSIVLNNVRMTFVGGADESQAQSQGFSPFSILQSYAIYCRNVQHLELNNVRVGFDEKDLRPAIFGENLDWMELNGFRAQRQAQSGPDVEGTNLNRVTVDGNELPPASVHVTGIEMPTHPARAGDPFPAVVHVENTGTAGLANVALRMGDRTVSRSVSLNAGERAAVWFLNLRCPEPGVIELSAGGIGKQITVAEKDSGHPASPPYRTAQSTQADFRQIGDKSFYIRAGGDHPVMQKGDQYGAIYLPKALPAEGSVVVKLENPDLRTSWFGRAGIIVRSDISKPGEAAGYVVLSSSPAAGSYLEWQSDTSGRLNEHSEFDGYTLWPHWLKLQRQGNRFIGYSSRDGERWEKIAEAVVPGATGELDAGMFCYRDSARFEQFEVTK